jgi:raffinose/stachyose/melibiose transport system permease protein
MKSSRGRMERFGAFAGFAGPCVFAFLTTTVLSFGYGLYLTFTDWDAISSARSFVGLANYAAMLADGKFWSSFLLTLRFVLVAVVLTNVIGFALAYLLTKGLKSSNFFKASFFATNLIGGIIVGLIWRFIFNEGLVALADALRLGSLRTSMLSSPNGAFAAICVVFVWQASGYMMVIYIAGIMGVPKDVLEAASIDGASKLRTLFKVTLPMVMPSITICTFLTLQRAFMTYDINLALTQGGPFGSTELVAMRIYNKAFISEQYGIGQSEAIMLFLMVAAVTLAQVLATKRAEVEA